MRNVLMSLVVFAAFAGTARAQEVSAAASTRAARHHNALELALGLGPTGGYGKLESAGPNAQDMGISLDGTAGWRINQQWMVGAYGTGGLFPTTVSGRGETYTASAGLQAAYHFGAPWIAVGAGWHGYWLEGSQGRVAYNGVDLARLQIGVEVPVTPAFSLDPYGGMTVTRFLTKNGAAADDMSGTTTVFLTAGAMARFDLFGGRGPTLLARN